jgi:hypothetical protein
MGTLSGPKVSQFQNWSGTMLSRGFNSILD